MARNGTGRIYQRGSVWWIQYGHRGVTYRETSKSKQKKDATALLRKRMAEMGSGKLVGPSAEKVTFEDLAKMIEADYKVNGKKSAKRLRTALAHVRSFFGTSRALDITTDRINLYIAVRQEEGAANASIQKELAALKRAFRLAVQAGTLTSPPYIPSVRVSNIREGFFEMAELERVIAELPEPLRPVVRFAAFTGWRKGEILPLQWARVDFEAGVVRLAPGETKNKEGREFPFHALPALAALLEAQREHTHEIEKEQGRIIPWVFHRNGDEIRYMDHAWRKACDRAGLGGWLFHDIRRTAVRNLERAGVSRSVAMKLTGHKTEEVYRRYAIADAGAMQEGVEKLSRLHAEKQEPAKVTRIQKGASGWTPTARGR